ncbi:MAG: hypothetical protein M1830_006506 [Pleopsidium flavum]|nr:MAG: hypothetical protein M1830_006506 [Pleopsidium flavum]
MTEVLTSMEPQPKSSRSVEQLIRSLDSLLERYLHLLDQYQSVQQQLSKELSDGYFSLAQANFKSLNRIRYGKDFYDGRMQASRRVTVKPSTTSTSSPNFSITDSLHITSAASDSNSETIGTNASSASQGKNAEENEAKNASRVKVSNCDPLNWFGILVPPALRVAQASFSDAVTHSILLMAGVELEMQIVEEEIRNIRRELRKGG